MIDVKTWRFECDIYGVDDEDDDIVPIIGCFRYLGSTTKAKLRGKVMDK